MKKLLIAVDGSQQAQQAVAFAIAASAEVKPPPEIHLVTVQPPLPYSGRVTAAIGREAVETYYRDHAAEMLKSARETLDRAGLRYTVHAAIGEPADEIVRIAAAQHCDLIVMGTHGRGRIGNIVLGSVAQKVLHLTRTPVTLVP